MSNPQAPFEYTREQWEQAVYNLSTSTTYPPLALEAALDMLLGELSTATNLSYEQQALFTGVAGVLLHEAAHKLRSAEGAASAELSAHVPTAVH